MQPTICIRKLIACQGRLLLLCFLGLLSSQPVWSLCSATPQAALASYQGNSPAKTEEQASGQGFRVWRTMKDPALGRRWFWIEACGAAQRPAQLLWAPLSLEQITPVTETPAIIEDHLLVHRGDAVVVTQASGALSMRLTGHALGQGELGGSIRVQIHAWNNVTVLAAKISGKDEVRLGD